MSKSNKKNNKDNKNNQSQNEERQNNNCKQLRTNNIVKWLYIVILQYFFILHIIIYV